MNKEIDTHNSDVRINLDNLQDKPLPLYYLTKKSSGQSQRRSRFLECPVCLDKNELYIFSQCKHRFCRNCLTQHILNSIQNFKVVKCLQEECLQTLQIQSPHIKQISKPQQQKYYQILAFKNLSQKNSTIKLCPTEDCQGFIDISAPPVTCAICKFKFCKECLMHFHLGDCDQNVINIGKKKFLFQSCMKCRMLLQKNEGCNHMTCKCGYQFCYLCGGQWKQYHQCKNAYNAPISPPNLNVNNQNEQLHNQSESIIVRIFKIIAFMIIMTSLFPFIFVVSCQCIMTTVVSIPLPFILVIALLACLPAGVVKMWNDYSWREMILGNIFIWLYCAMDQYIEVCRQLYVCAYGDKQLPFFLPFTCLVAHKLKQALGLNP